MPSIAEATRARRGRRRRRLLAGVGLLLVGALFVGVGAAGAAGAGSVRNGAIVGGLAVLVCFVLLADRAPLHDYDRTVSAVGAALGLAGMFLLWGTTSGEPSSPSAAAFAAVLYVSGILVMGAAVLAAVTLRAPRSDGKSAGVVGWERSDGHGTIGSGGREAAADGGETDDELSFPLDDR